MKASRLPRCALVALSVLPLLALNGGCTSRWAVRGNVDLTGDATAAGITPQAKPVLADPRIETPESGTTGK